MIEFIKYLQTNDKKFANSSMDDFLITNLNEFQQIFDNHLNEIPALSRCKEFEYLNTNPPQINLIWEL